MNESIVNIGVTTFNRLPFTKRSIDSIIKNTIHPYTLTVVDNNSQDGTVEYLKELKDNNQIKNLILLDENIGVAKASNLGWQMEETNYYVKYDNDIIVNRPNWLKPMIDIIDITPNISMIGYCVISGQAPPLRPIGEYKIREAAVNLGGACVLIPKRTKEEFGYWCEDYGLYAEEDMDYGVRIKQSGKISVYMEDATQVEHIDHDADIVDTPEYKSYFHWKHLARRDALKALANNRKKYQADPGSMFITPSMCIEDVKDKIYQG